MRIVVVEPGKAAYESEIENSLNAEQEIVGGYIEEGKLQGLKGNRHLDNGTSIIAGTFFIVGDGGEDFRSLTDEETEKYLHKYVQPEEISDEEVESDMGCAMYFM